MRLSRGTSLRVLALAVLAAPGITDAQTFSSAPLSAPIAFPTNSLPVAAPALTDWLVAKAPSGTSPEAQQIREQLYAVIAQLVKQRFASTQSTDLPSRDSTLAKLFAWGDRLGVPGAADVASTLGGDSLERITPIPLADFQLTLSGPLFSLAAVKGRWMVRFPYYFMLGTLAHQVLNNGIDNDIAMMSTLTTTNSAANGGASQATIIIVSAQTEDLPAYVGFWLQQLHIAPADTAPNPVPQARRSYRLFEPSSGLWKELVAFSIPSGSLIAAYIGLDGTYQTNRPHFIDLLTSLQVRQ